MMATKKFSRSYPDTWSIQKIADFMANCRRTGAIPNTATMKSRRRRGGMIEVTWTWKV